MSRPPPLLEPYLSLTSLPEASLTLLTSILGATTNWLVLRYLQSLLLAPAEPPTATTVLLVSFLRDYTFWKESASRMGLDLESLAKKGRFGYVDGLSFLFAGGPEHRQQGQRRWALTSPALGEVSRMVGEAVEGMGRGGGRVVLIVDGLDFLLAATGEEEVDGEGVRGLLMGLREKSYVAIVTVAADEPLVGGQQVTGLEREHVGFVVSLAHDAKMVVSLRLLDTGTAKDVSGVVRITRGGDDDGITVEDCEYLYHIAGDGGVRVFERGQ